MVRYFFTLLVAHFRRAAMSSFVASTPLLVASVVALLIPAFTSLPAFAADMNKVIRTTQPSAETNFDCAAESDEATATFCNSIFEPLLQYDYLARPVRLQGRTSTGLPAISPDGRTYTFKLRPGIFFTPDAAFNGSKRELVANDYAYSIKRILDPKLISKWQFLFDKKLVDADALVEDAKKTGKFNYDRPIAGLEAPDKYTLVIRLVKADYNLSYILATTATGAVAREVVEYYGRNFPEHPVGTGPYKLKSWQRSLKVVMEANPDFREEYFHSSITDDPILMAAADPRDLAIAAHLKGKRLPLVGRIEVSPIEEEQPRWLAFLNNEHDYIRTIPTPFIETAVPGGKLARNLEKIGMTTRPDEVAWLQYTTFNMKDKTIGGYTPEKIALRRAMTMAYPAEDEITIIEKNQALKAWSHIPQGMAGFVDDRTDIYDYNPARANALLDMFGYKDIDGDGWREMPDGSPLVVDMASTPNQRDRSKVELWRRAMERIGIRLTNNKVEKLPDLRKQAQLGKVQMFFYGWIADYPDGENYLQLFTTASIGGPNYSLFSLPEYDQLYAKVVTMPDSPERTALYRRMVRLLWVYNPWRVTNLKQGTILIQPWLLGYRKHPFVNEAFMYMDIDLQKLPK